MLAASSARGDEATIVLPAWRKCTQRSDDTRPYRWIKTPHAKVTIPNGIPTQSRPSQLSLVNPGIHSCHWNRRRRNGIVVGRATTYKMGMTVPQSQPTPNASNDRTGCAWRKQHGAHLPAEIRSWRLVDEIWIPWQGTESTPGQGAESRRGGKPASAPSNWRW